METTDDARSADKNLEYALLERALSASQSGIVITDCHQRNNPILWCNPGFLKLTGYRASEVMGRDCRFMQGAGTDPATIKLLRESVAAGTDCRVEILNYRRNGESFVNALHISPIHDEQGHLTHYVGVQSEAGGDNPAGVDRAAEIARVYAYAEAIVDTVRDPLLVLDGSLRVVSANLSFYAVFKVTPVETENRLIYEVGGGQWNIPALRQLLTAVIKNHKVIRDFEVTHDFPRIGRKTMALNGRVVASENDLPERILLAMEDVTHLPKVLDSSVDFARGVLNALSAHVAILDDSGVIVAVNEAWNRFALANGGTSGGADEKETDPGAFVGANYMTLCENAEGRCAEDARAMGSGIRAVLAGTQDSYEHEYPCHAPNEKRWFVGRVTRLEYSGRSYLIVAHENVTTRKLSELALHQTEERYRRLAENADEYAIVTTDEEGIVTAWNHGAELVFGYREEDIRGENSRLLFLPDDQEAGVPERELAAARERGRASDTRYMMRKGGVAFFAEGVTFPLYDDGGELIGFGKLLRDFTERHQSEQAIKNLNARLQRAMAETHHRVRNNLQILTALIDLERMRQPDAAFDAELTRLGYHVQAMAVVHDLLTQTARRDGTADTLSAQDILTALFASLGNIAGGRRIAHHIEDVLLPVQEGTSLAIIANELVLNALNHSKTEVGVSFRVENGQGILAITDDGPGFPADFAPAAEENTGLELIIGLVEMDLKGEVTFANRPESGAVVTVKFPLSAS